MIVWPIKDPDEVVDYSVDWTLALVEDEIVTSDLVVVSGSATVQSTSNTTLIVTATIAGGTSGETTTFRNTITTIEGKTYEETITLDVVSSEFPIGPTTTRKRVLIEMAVEELRLAGYEFNFSPEEYVSALRRLDGIAQMFPEAGYNAPAVFGQGEVDDPSGLLDAEVGDFALLLAESLAPTIGKTLSPTAAQRIAKARVGLLAKYAVLPVAQPAYGTPLGSGHRRSFTGPFARLT